MDRSAHAFATGLFVILLGLGLLFAARWLSEPEVEQLPYQVVSTTSVAGLSPYSRVYYRGVEVGQVASIRFAGDGSRDILIDILLETGVPVTANTYGVLKAQGLTGMSQIELLDDGPRDAPPLPTSSAQPARIAMRPSLLESFQTVGQGIAEQIQQLADNVNRLLTPETAERIGRILANLEQISRHADATLAASRPALEQARTTFATADHTLAAATRTLALLQDRLRDAGTIAAHADAAVTEIGTRVTGATLPELEATLGALTQAARRFEQLSATLERNPPALLFGAPPLPPGPGESGYRGD